MCEQDHNGLEELCYVRIPQFRSNWTHQMSSWLVDMTGPYFYDLSPEQIRLFLKERWSEICDSWGDKDKWNRVVGCVDIFDSTMVSDIGRTDWNSFKAFLNNRSNCWAEGCHPLYCF